MSKRGWDGEKGRLQSEAMSDDYYYYSGTWWRGWSRRSRVRNVYAGISECPQAGGMILLRIIENGRAETFAASLWTAQTRRAYRELFFKRLLLFCEVLERVKRARGRTL